MNPLRAAIGLALILAPSICAAQDENGLRRTFEGTRVRLLIDMPGAVEGVDVSPQAPLPFDFERYRNRLKKYPIAIAARSEAVVTRLRLRKSHIEFQLDGGGYGTFSDILGGGESESNGSAPAGQTAADRERVARERGGSRFNLRFEKAVPPAFLTPDSIRAALAKFISFMPDTGMPAAPAIATGIMPADTAGSGLTPSLEEVEWTASVGWGDQLFPSYLIATAAVRPGGIRARDPYTLGDMNGQIGITLTAPEAGVRVGVTLSAPGFIDQVSSEFVLPRAGQRYTIRPQLPWDYAILARVNQTRPATVTVRLRIRDTELPDRVIPFVLRSVNDAPFYVRAADGAGGLREESLAWMFAAYVNENHPLNEQLRREALDAGIVRSFDGYQSGNPQTVVAQAYAFWNVLQRRGVKYSSITTTAAESPFVFSQQVRLLDQAIDGAQANCVDGSVLFASLLRQIGIDPVLVLAPGHMYVGFYVDPAHQQIAFLETTRLGRADLRTDTNWMGLGELFGRNPSWSTFVGAWQEATRAYEAHVHEFTEGSPEYQLIDVGAARELGILPITYSR